MTRKLTAILFGLVLLSLTQLCFAKQSWQQHIQQIRQEALAKGIRPEILDAALKGIHAPNRKVLKLDRTQPEKRLTFLKYRNTRADAYRIKIGRKEIKKYHDLLTTISNQYGVSPCFIVALWGLETSYGRYMGKFPVIKSLVTLSYDNRRSAFFRKQLFYALEILNDEHVKPEHFKGEWAGASGHPQFLPSNWHHYAVDYNGDGRRDIWKTLSDSLASIANFLHKHGWKTGGLWAVEVTIPADFPKADLTRKVVKTVAEWKTLGVKPERSIGNDGLEASVIKPYGGPAMMIFNNFRVIMRWNRSTYYAGTVGYTAEKICRQNL
ncbi:MAG: lytic murein transglycosylase [Gammaproteobacteria bacterium]|nr:lytic murein transglycosylase [Gammaproteobacteria bacterium]